MSEWNVDGGCGEELLAIMHGKEIVERVSNSNLTNKALQLIFSVHLSTPSIYPIYAFPKPCSTKTAFPHFEQEY